MVEIICVLVGMVIGGGVVWYYFTRRKDGILKLYYEDTDSPPHLFVEFSKNPFPEIFTKRIVILSVDSQDIHVL